MSNHRLAYYESGNQVNGTIIAFHGVTDNAASLVDIATRFGSRWRVVLIDSLGHGISPRFTKDELSNPFAAAVAAAEATVSHILESSLHHKVVALGHSMGGAITTQLAVRHPQWFHGVVLEDPALLTPEQQQRYLENAPYLVEQTQYVSENPTKAIAELRAEYPRWTQPECTAWAQAKAQVDRSFVETGVVGLSDIAALDRLVVPALVVSGDGDDILLDAARTDSLTSPHLKVVRIAQASHTVRRDQPQTFFAAVEDFLDELVSAESQVPTPYIRPDMVEVVANTPAQDMRDVLKLRARANTMFSSSIAWPEGINLSETDVVGRKVRIVSNSDEPRVVILSLHGGGYVSGRPQFDDERHVDLLRLVSDLECPDAAGHVAKVLIASPDYRLAPEHPYPANAQDAAATLVYLAQKYPDAQLIVYGDSAGAGTGLQMFTQDIPVDVRTRVKCFVAMEPCLEPYMNSLSWVTYRNGPVWDRQASEGAWAHFLSVRSAQSADVSMIESQVAECSVYRLPEACEVPPMCVVVNSADPLRDEGINLATRLTDAGVETELWMCAGSVHGGLSIPGSVIWEQNQHNIARFIQHRILAQ
ncbi:acetyl esterase/lipase [Arcanobacterium pluranimalium]|uniref:alpha/beta hydrolase n=1 Tax=Arcanobacterium pluranimalium TaxID=108028 RepID=UPI00195DD121|nr:alpha/beta hydrolase [Arcanobacterium pluranimalium]MBM7824831.1 acetyl esterase/lipase [Arcanobacterium pluranimalium]